MRKTSKFMVLAFAAGIALAPVASFAQYAQGPPPPPREGYQGGGGWDAPPSEYQDEFRRNGFHDGIEGARKDYENHRAPNVNNRDEFRHPHVPRNLRHDYREGFRRGYDVGVQHMMSGGPGPR